MGTLRHRIGTASCCILCGRNIACRRFWFFYFYFVSVLSTVKWWFYIKYQLVGDVAKINRIGYFFNCKDVYIRGSREKSIVYILHHVSDFLSDIRYRRLIYNFLGTSTVIINVYQPAVNLQNELHVWNVFFFPGFISGTNLIDKNASVFLSRKQENKIDKYPNVYKMTLMV